MIIYTLVGSLLMLVAAIATAVLSADAVGGVTFSIETLRQVPLADRQPVLDLRLLLAAFLVKMPAFLVHGWMADAYRACPLPVLVLLGGVLSKVAAYGFLRIVIPLFPDASVHFQDVLLIIGLCLDPLRLGDGLHADEHAPDRRLLVDRADGLHHDRDLQPQRRRRRRLGDPDVQPRARRRAGLPDHRPARPSAPAPRTSARWAGMAKRAPVLAILFMIVTMALLAIPGSANFVGEFFILKGVFETKVAIALIASTGIALAAFYALRMYQRTMHNRLPEGTTSREVTLREAVVLRPARRLHHRPGPLPRPDHDPRRGLGGPKPGGAL